MTHAPHSGIETPDDLKQELADQLRWVCVLFGQPSELLGFLALPEWRRLRVWVRGLEALAARLVRALAATLPASGAPLRPAPVPRIERTAPDTDYPDSERWTGVRIRLRDEAGAAPLQRAADGETQRVARAEQSDVPLGFRSARRLALRLEAVIRVAEDALRYAQRLARRKARPEPRTPHARGRRAARLTATRAARVTALGPPLRPPVLGTG